MPARRVLLIANDVVGERMAGPGIRLWEFARVLSRDFAVTLALPPFLDVREPPPRPPDFPLQVLACRRPADLRRLVDGADVVVTLGAVVLVYPFLARTGKPLVVDAYDPFLLAGLEQFRASPLDQRLEAHERYRRAHSLALGAADLVLCAHERQRDYWLGMLSGLGRVNPYTHDEDPTLRRLVHVVPFGLPATPPRHTRAVLKGVLPGVGRDDRVVLWGGGIWNWLDAPTAIRAVAILAERRPDLKLVFMGTARPNDRLARMSAIGEAIELSRRFGLTGRAVFFGDWVPYVERQDYLLEADLGLSLHRDLLEARFAFRTRVMDYLWAALPLVVTRGDALSEEVEQAGLGAVTAPGDAEGTAGAILRLLDTPDLRERLRPRFAAVADRYRWEAVVAPLVAFCHEPRLAPDRAYMRTLGKPWQRGPARAWSVPGRGALGRLAAVVRGYVRRGSG